MTPVITIGITAVSFLYFLRWPGKGLALLLFLLPFSVALNPWPGADLQLLRLLVPLFWLAVFLKQPPAFLREVKKPQALLLWLFLVIATLATVFASQPFWSLRKLLYLWSLAPFMVAVGVVLKENFSISSKNIYSVNFRALFLGGVAVSVFGIAQFVSQFFISPDALFRFFVKLLPHTQGNEFGTLITQYPSWFVNIAGRDYLRAFAFFPDPHIFAFYLSILAASTLPFLFSAKTKKEFIVLVTRYSLLVTALLLTFSRGGYLGVAASTVTIISLLYYWKTTTRIIPLATLGAGMILLFIALGAPMIGRFVSSFDVTEGSNIGRLEIWEDALQKAIIHPFGVGLGNYAATTDDALDIRNPVTAHNLYLDLLVETGILGLAAFVGFILFGAIRLSRLLKNGLPHSVGILGALAGFSVHAFFENPLYAPAVFILLLFVISLSWPYHTSS